MVKRLTIILLLFSQIALAQVEKLGGTGGAGGTSGFQTNIAPVTVFSITTVALPSVTVNSSYSQTITVQNGTSPYSFTIMLGSLPPGLSINSSSGAISGTATSVGNYTFTVLATDSTSPTHLTATQQLTIAVTCTPLAIVSNASLPPATVGTAYQFQFNSQGGQGTVAWVASGLSPPYSVSSSGLLTGTPTAANTQTFTVTATDSCPSPQSVQQQATLVTNNPVQIVTTSPLPSGQVGTAYNLQFSAQGGTPPYAWVVNSGTLPTGLALSSSGSLVGAPTASGTFNFTVQVTDSASVTSSTPFTLVINCATLAITTTSLPNGSQGSPYNFQMTSSGGTGSPSWSATSLPNGLNISTSGAITGTPTNTGTFNPTFTATDNCVSPQTAQTTLPVTIVPALTITTSPTLPTGTVGAPYTAQMAATGGTPPYAWSIVAGALTSGLAMNTAGLISGTPAVSVSDAFTVQVADSAGAVTQQVETLVTSCPPLAMTSTSPLPLATQGLAYSFQFTASGGLLPLKWALIQGALPTGLSVSSTGLLSGTPTQTGVFSAVIQAVDSCSPSPQSVQSTFQLSVQANSGPLTIATTSPLQAATENASYSVPLAATGGTTPYVWSLSSGTLPSGFSLSSSGVISGTATTTGTSTFTVKVTDALSNTATKSLSITVSCTTLAITSTSPLPNATQGQPYSFQFLSSGGTGAVTWTGTGIPAGLSLSTSGLLSGTPTGSTSPNSIPATFFGLHDNHAPGTGDSPFPTVSFGSYRFWDADTAQWANSSGTGEIETARGVYNFTPVDNWIAALNSHGVTDVMFTFGFTPSWCGPSPTQPCTSNTDFLNFITAMCNRYCGFGAGKIAHWEAWNEVTSSTFWTGTMAQLVVIQNDVYTTIKGICPTCTVHTPVTGVVGGGSDCTNSGAGTYSLNNFVNAMTAANGAGNFNFDVVDLHFYPYPAGSMPETGFAQYQVPNAKCAMTNLGISSKPLWDTENGWGLNSDLPSSTNQVAYVGRSYLLQWSEGIARDYWYAYDNSAWGTLWNGSSLTAAGTAYQQVSNWMSGSSLTTACTNVSGSVWTCGFTEASGKSALAAWNTSSSSSFTITAGQWGDYRDLSGGTTSISPSATSVTIGISPIFLESSSSGSPTSFTLNITATDSCLATHQTATGMFNLTINPAPPPLQITTASTLPGATQGVGYSSQMAATGGVTPYAWSITSGTLPAGLVMNAAGLISGTPTTIGTSTVTIQVSDAASHTATGTFSLTVSCVPLSITSGLTLPTGTQSQAYSDQLTASGGTGALAWSLVGGTLPTGVTLSSGGLISGTPSVSGSFSPQIRVTDSCSTPQTQTSTFSLTINPATVPLQITTPSPLPTATQNSAYNVTLSATGGTPPYGSWTVTVGTLPTGLSLGSSSGIISGTPTGTGTSSFTVQVADSVSTHATKAFSLTVNAATTAYNPHCSPGNTVTNLPQDGPAQPLQNCFYTARSATPSTGSTITVTSGSCSSLQSAINSATAGQTIVIPVATYACSISPAAAGTANNYITVITQSSANLPAEGTRLTPAWAGVTSLPGRPAYGQPASPGNYLPKIVSSTASTPALNIQATAAYWRFIGIEFASAANMDFFQIATLLQGANHIILDRVWINGADTTQLKNGVQAGLRINSSPYTALIDSTITNTGCINGNATCSGDSQGVFLGGSACATDGPLKITNNFIEVAGEGIFSGGGGCGSGTQPASDVEIAKNHVFKPLWMKSNDPSYIGFNFRVKNCLEFKSTVRALIEGNIFDGDWEGQSDQHGICVLFDSRNQNISVTGTASSNGTGTLTWLSGQKFTSNVVSQSCATPDHCTVTYNGVKYSAQTFVSANQITVSPAPPTSSSASFSQAEPGLNPSAAVSDITFRYNDIRNAANGMQISNPPSDNGDLSLVNARFTVHGAVMEGIDGTIWNTNKDCCNYGAGLQIQNFEGGSAALDQISIWHTTLLGTYSGGTTSSVAGSFGFGTQTVSGSQIGHLRIYDNISSGGWWSGSTNTCGTGTTAQAYWNCWTPVAQKCWDNNFMTTNTLAASGTGSLTHNNPPYPAPADNGYCPYGTAKGNTITTGSFAAIQFTNLNGAIGGNYQLLSTSPYHNKASDGTDPGVDWAAYQTAIAGVF